MTKKTETHADRAYRMAEAVGAKRHSDVAEDKALIKKTVKPAALRAKGGKAPKSKTQINVIMAPRDKSAAPVAAPQGLAAGTAGVPSPRPVPAAPAPTGGLASMLGSGRPTPPLAAKGGKVKKRKEGGSVDDDGKRDSAPVRTSVGYGPGAPSMRRGVTVL